MDVKAHLRYLRVSPRKVRLALGLIRGLSAEKAIDQLTILPKPTAYPVLKLLKSAIANAEHNFKIDVKDLTVKTAVANEGPKLKRWRPRAFGRAAEILKRTSHVTIVLTAPTPAKKTEVKEAAPKKVDGATIKRSAAKPAVKRTPKVKKSTATDKEQQRDATDVTVARKGNE